ncbi:hypothetical protein COV16_07460 [Candidatus Woesearchaeota archaeon CG10_big_fil_rev_8_21_14_0_10_34_8]|nr:MAG: hypothetical protein COV16_07460 [Candidatus Woesearchaeota archaeon CG10_big_fil_rev_8_21_14_0_10_34_8]
MNKTKYILFYLIPLILYACFIIYLSSIPVLPTIRGVITDEPVPKGAWTGDEVEHIIEYAILAFLFYRAVIQTKYKNIGIVGTIVFCVLFGISDEIHQNFVLERTSSILDLSWDFVGSLIIVFTSKFIQ